MCCNFPPTGREHITSMWRGHHEVFSARKTHTAFFVWPAKYVSSSLGPFFLLLLLTKKIRALVPVDTITRCCRTSRIGVLSLRVAAFLRFTFLRFFRTKFCYPASNYQSARICHGCFHVLSPYRQMTKNGTRGIGVLSLRVEAFLLSLFLRLFCD